MQRQTTLIAALLLLPGALSAQRTGTFLEPLPTEGTTRVAQRGANFLEIGVGARARGMGDAYSGLATGATATYWNPAGLGSVERFTAAFSHLNLYGDLGLKHEFAAVVLPVFGGGLGVSYIRLSSGDILRTDEVNPGGGAAQFGEFFTFDSQAYGIHYGRRLTDRLQVGFTGRVVTEGISEATITWWGVDFGTMFNTGLYGVTLGATLANIGPTAAYKGGLVETRVNTDQAFPIALPIQFKTTGYTLPTTFRFALVWALTGGADALLRPGGKNDLKMAFELNDATDTDIQSSVGAEYSYNHLVFLRVGKKFVNEARDNTFRSMSHDLSFGGGLRVPLFGNSLSVDYAYTNMGELQNVHAFSFEFGGSQ
jgi:hypothetical protein